MTTIVLVTAGIVLCVFLSNFFSGSEMAYSSCNKIRLESEKEDGSKKAALALTITEKFDDALSAILIGNNLVNIACSSLGSVFIILLTGGDSLAWLSTAVITVLVIIFGETIPKITVKKAATRYALRYAYPVHALMVVLGPLVKLVVWLIGLITKPLPDETEDSASEEEAVEELQTLIETAEDEKILDENRSELVQAAIEFSDISASEAMTARVDVTAIDIEDDLAEIYQVLEKAKFTRIPVYEGDIDHVIGILHMNHVLKALTERETLDIRSLLLKPCFVYKAMKLPEVLRVMRREKQHLAIVVDEYGGTSGIISMEDVVEKVVGDIWDETDTIEKELEQVSENEYRIDGDMSIFEFLDLVGIREEDFEAESETVGGWTIEQIGTFPKEGDSFTYGNMTVTVLKMDERRVERVRVVLQPDEKEPEHVG